MGILALTKDAISGDAHKMNFICTTMMCVQQYLGIGYVVAQSSNQFIYSNFKDEYACSVSSQIYQCTKGSIDDWQRNGGDKNW
jgi:hypothetical protein